jgi:hypothetical protein
MTLVSSRRIASDHPRPPVAGRHGRSRPGPRLGLLRLAPKLSVVPGNVSGGVNWPGMAGGIGAALRDGFDPDDAPLCA